MHFNHQLAFPEDALRISQQIGGNILCRLYPTDCSPLPVIAVSFYMASHLVGPSKPVTESEAIKVRTTLINNNAEASTTADASVSSSTDNSFCEIVTLEEAIHDRLTNFFDKRRASGDARPCGPHDMFPIYASIFGIEKAELKDEHFLGRLRRSGLGDTRSQPSEICVKGQKKGGNGKRS